MRQAALPSMRVPLVALNRPFFSGDRYGVIEESEKTQTYRKTQTYKKTRCDDNASEFVERTFHTYLHFAKQITTDGDLAALRRLVYTSNTRMPTAQTVRQVLRKSR
jgi:hypothetical protein